MNLYITSTIRWATHQHSGYASVNETYTYSYDHADRFMNTTQGCQVVKIDDQVEDPTYKGLTVDTSRSPTIELCIIITSRTILVIIV